MMRAFGAILAAGALTFTAGGCVERTISVDSEPRGALVYMNDQEAGRTPFSRPFTWYGTYDVAVRKEGYETLKTKAAVIAPAWQWVPIDLLAEIAPFPLKDRHKLMFTLNPVSEQTIDPQQLVKRGASLRERLESGEKTKTPTTRPTTAATKPAARPATQAVPR